MRIATQQLSLFTLAAQQQCVVPPAVAQALTMGAALAVSISGGKDSDAMLRHLVKLHHTEQWTGELFAITADLGRIEWPGTLDHIQAICSELDVPLVVVRRQKGSMIDRWDERRHILISQQNDDLESTSTKEGDKPFWSSSTARYCTKELKTAEVDRYLRRFSAVVCAVGIRAEESSNRAKKAHVQVRNDITTKALKTAKGLSALQHEAWANNAIAQWIDNNCKGRLALTWNAVLDWDIDQVWEMLGTSGNALENRRILYQDGDFLAALEGWPAHWAYVSGNSRLSCSMCVLASSADIYNGAQHNISTWLELALMESQSGWSFQQGKWLSNLSIDTASRLGALGELHRALAQLQLLTPWHRNFVIALVRSTPTVTLMLLHSTATIALSKALSALTNNHV